MLDSRISALLVVLAWCLFYLGLLGWVFVLATYKPIVQPVAVIKKENPGAKLLEDRVTALEEWAQRHGMGYK